MNELGRLVAETARAHARQAVERLDKPSQPVMMWVANVEPLRVTTGTGNAMKATRAEDYTPVAGDKVEVQRIGRSLFVRGKVHTPEEV